MNRSLQFHERSQYFISARDKTLSVAMRVCNPDCFPASQNRARIVFDCRSAVALKHCEKYPMHIYRGVDLISDVLPFGALWYAKPNAISNAVDYAKFFSRSHDAVIRVYDDAGNVIDTHEHAGDFKEW